MHDGCISHPPACGSQGALEKRSGKCLPSTWRETWSSFHSFADSFGSSSSVPSHICSLRTPNCLSDLPSVAWSTCQPSLSVVSLSLVSTPKSILHGIQGELSKLRSDLKTLLLQTVNEFCFPHKVITLILEGKATLSRPLACLCQPECQWSSALFLLSVWQGVLGCHALSYFLTIPACPPHLIKTSHSSFLCPFFMKAFPEYFQVWTGYPPLSSHRMPCACPTCCYCVISARKQMPCLLDPLRLA